MTKSNAQNVKVTLEIPTHFPRVSSSDDLKPSAETKDFKIKLQEVNEKVQQHRTAQIINPIFSSMYLCIFGLTSCYGIVLKTHNMSERDWDVDDEEVEYWTKATFFPLVPLTYLAGGVLIDRIGSIKTYRIMLTLVTFGLLLESYLANLNNFVGYMTGKVIISAFHGTMIVSQATLIAKWSRDTDEFSTRVGFIFYMGSTGSAIGPLFFGWLSKSVDETFIFTCLIPSLIVGLFAIGLQATFIDKKGETFEEHLRGTILLTRPEFESLKGTKTLFCLFALAYILINPGSNLAALNFDWTILRAAEFDQFLPTAIFVVVGVVSGGWVRAFGRMIHNKGKRINLMIVTGLVVLLLNSTLFKLRDPTPYPLNLGVWIIAIGVVFWRAMQAVVYQPLVALLIKPKFLGTAYGILFFFIETLNIQLTNWKESVLTKDNTAVDATYWLQTCAICLIVSSIAVTAVLLVVDLKKGGKLNRTGATFVDQKKFIEDLDILNLEVSTDASPEAMISYPKNDKDVVASNLKNTGDCLVNSNSNNNSALNEPRVRRSKSHFG